MQSDAEMTLTTLKEFVNVYNRHDVDAIMEFFTDDCVMDAPKGPGPGGVRSEGKQQVRRGVEARFEGLPDAHYGDDRHWIVGNFGVSEWTLTGTQTSGERLEVRGCDHFHFSDGKIAVKNSFWKIVETADS